MPELPARTLTAPTRTPHWRWQLLFVAVGAMALGAQTYLLREFIVVLQGDEMAVGVGLAAWFVGIVAGALAMRHFSEAAARYTATVLLTLLGLVTGAEMLFARFARPILGLSAFEPLALGPTLTVALCLFCLPGFCVGSVFVALAVLSAKALGSARNAIGNLYVFEACGSLAAGLLTSFLLTLTLEPLRGAAILIGASLLLTLGAARVRLLACTWLIALCATAALALGLLPFGDRIERWAEGARFATLSSGNRLLSAKTTPYQHVAIGGTEQHVLYANGKYTGSFPDETEHELFAHELMLFSERPQRVASFGGLETGMLRHCLKHPLRSLDLVLLDERAFHIVESHLSREDRGALADPRVRIIFEDPRRFLSSAGPAYDLVISLEPDPSTLFLARTTSLEFDRLVRSRLNADGVYVTRFSAGPNVQLGEVGALGATLYRTLRDTFSVVRATPEPNALFVAGNSTEAVTVDAEKLGQRYRERRIQSDVFAPELLGELLPAERVAALNRELEESSHSAEIASDDRPIAFRHALGTHQQISKSSWSALLGWSSQHPIALALLLLGPSLVLLSWQRLLPSDTGRRIAAVHATAITGGCGLVANLLLFVSFQTRVGALYSDLGALSGLFMMGLALGGVVSTRARRPKILLLAQELGCLLTLLLTLSLALASRLPPSGSPQWLLHGTLLVCAGFSTGLVFPAACRQYLSCLDEPDETATRRVASSIELWDHAGAALAALLSAILLIPTFGLMRCSVLLLALQTVALVATSVSARARGSLVRNSGTCRP